MKALEVLEEKAYEIEQQLVSKLQEVTAKSVLSKLRSPYLEWKDTHSLHKGPTSSITSRTSRMSGAMYKSERTTTDSTLKEQVPL